MSDRVKRTISLDPAVDRILAEAQAQLIREGWHATFSDTINVYIIGDVIDRARNGQPLKLSDREALDAVATYLETGKAPAVDLEKAFRKLAEQTHQRRARKRT